MDDKDYVRIWRAIDEYVHARDFAGLFAWLLYVYMENPQISRHKALQKELPDIPL